MKNAKEKISVTVNGVRYRKTWSALGITSQVEADEAVKRIKASLLRGDKITDLIISDIISEDINLKELYRRTANAYWSSTKHGEDMVKMSELIMSIIGHNTLVKNIDLNVIDNLIASCKDQGNSDATINRKLSNISKALTYAYKRQLIDKKPQVEWRKENKGRIRFFTHEEELKITSLLRLQSQDEMADFVTFLIDTGLRRGEALRLIPEDFIGNKIIVWEKRHSKNRESRAVPLTRRAQKIIKDRAHRTGKLFKLTRTQIRDKWNRVRGHLNYHDDPHFVLHTLRHTCASRLVQNGITIQVVKEWLGHSSLSVTLRYAHLSKDSLGDAVAALEPKEEVRIVA